MTSAVWSTMRPTRHGCRFCWTIWQRTYQWALRRWALNSFWELTRRSSHWWRKNSVGVWKHVWTAHSQWMKSWRRWYMTPGSHSIFYLFPKVSQEQLMRHRRVETKKMIQLGKCQNPKRRPRLPLRPRPNAQKNSSHLNSSTKVALRFAGLSIWEDARIQSAMVDAKRAFTYVWSAIDLTTA